MYYKVVNKDLKSALSIQLKNYAIQYKIGEWVYPHPGTYLMVFDDLLKALEFCNTPDESTDVYECEIVKENIIEFPFFQSVFSGDKLAEFLDLFLEYPDYIVRQSINCLPNNSVLASSVKLISKVKSRS